VYADHARYTLALGVAPAFYPKTESGDDAKRETDDKTTFQLCSAISPRIGAMRLRALLLMAEIVSKNAEVRATAKLDELQTELEGYKNLAKMIGLEARFDEQLQALKNLQTPAKEPAPPTPAPAAQAAQTPAPEPPPAK
jgi:hypothetical protein